MALAVQLAFVAAGATIGTLEGLVAALTSTAHEAVAELSSAPSMLGHLAVARLRPLVVSGKG